MAFSQVIYCDGSNYESVTSSSGNQVHRNKAIGALVPRDHWDSHELC